MPALQLGLGPVRTVLAATEVLTVLLGLVISYIALRGYRRNRSRPMAFVSVGFALLVGGPAVAFLLFRAVPGVSELAAAVVTQVCEVAGMGCILYGLRARP